ncbi:MAG: AmmeMemoRadiSam system protein B [Alphaproteobacteria bacterium]|uniref:MEMO1 family protein K8I29_09650 n=1 Tax=Candidatus Nitrobium versatile TaxID=2884831 RepID=A0A953JEW4_9BACT|nr:AmmeMemoRadiSam system protein B [Candidatus Nitrobium versatile]
MKRRPAVAGQFYYGDAARLKSQVEQYAVPAAVREKAIGIISPHAGLMYSGAVAGAVYSSLQQPGTFLLLGPNHTGLGAPASLMVSGEWEIPSATLSLDESLAGSLLQKVPSLTADVQAHVYEHSLEVQLPFIAHFSGEAKIAPLLLMGASLKECEEMGRGIAAAIEEADYEVVIVASSDMSHYVSHDTAKRLDGLALQEILALDPERLYTTVRRERISMCGVVPVTVMLYAALALGASGAKLVRYATSGETSGDYTRVVGYAGVVVT